MRCAALKVRRRVAVTTGEGDPDAIIAGYVDQDLGLADLIAAGHDRELVQRVGRMIDAAEWKRRQYPPGPKISLKAFGRDRRLPISNRWRERADLR